MAKIIINKNYFKNLSKGTHTLRANFKDGYAEGQFRVDDKITFYIHMEEQFPFTATRGQTWSDWMQSFADWNTSGNGILYVSADQKLYVDPLNNTMSDYYGRYSTGDASLKFINDSWEEQTLDSVIVPNGIYGTHVCCFDPGTKILMADKTLKNIEDVIIGDIVVSYNEETSEFEEGSVVNTIVKHNSDDLVYIVLSDGTKIGMRAYHPLLTTDGWKSLRPELADTILDAKCNVSLLEVGDTLVCFDENKTIKEIIAREPIANYDTYNLTIAKNHNYVANGVVAHNAACKS